MYSLLIFDWDGTIIDSTARIVSCLQQAAKDVGLPDLQAHAAKDIIGLGLPEAIRVLYPDITPEHLEQMRSRYVHYYMHEDKTPTALFPGVKQTLEHLHQQGYRLAVATGKTRAGLAKVMAETGLGWLFEISRCADETASKPNPLMLNEILQETGVDIASAVMIGDTEFDLSMAAQAGMDCMAVSYGAHSLERLQQYKPVLEIHSFSEIGSWLARKTGEVV